MNVLHVIDSLDPVRGGPQVVVPSLAAAQAAMGHRVLILSNHPARAEAAVARQLREIPGSERVEVINLRHPNLIEKCLALIAGKRLRNVISGETFVHLHGVWEPMLWAVADIACHRGVPYAVRLCGILQPGQMNRYRVFKEVVFRLGARRMLHRASFVHALTEAEARFARPYIGNTPVEVIPNGVFPERFANLPPPGEFYRRHPDLQGHPYILFLSRLHPHKGILLLADAFALLASKLPEIHLVVAGPDGGEKTKFEQKMIQHGLRNRIHILDATYGAEKAQVYRDAACFCLPSRSEGLSNAILEALAFGVPVVITHDCHFPEVAEAGAGEVVERRPEEIARALESVLSDRERREQMSVAARRMVKERYNWHAIAQSTLLAYKKALERKRQDRKPATLQIP